MKKAIFLFSLCLTTYSLSFSQGINLNSAISYYEDFIKYGAQKSLPLAKEKIDLAATGEGTKDKYKTWYYKGLIYLAVFDLNLKNEMSKMQETDINKKLIGAYQTVSMAELEEALKSFQREIELDEKKIYAGEANAKIRAIAGDHYSGRAYSSLINKNYADAITYYEKAYEMKLKMNITDTAAMNNMAFSAGKMKDYKKAEQFYGKLIEMKYKPEKSYLSMIQMYNDAGDTSALRKTVMKAVESMPESYALLIEKINILLKENKSEAAINSISQALTKNANNHELHLVLGQTYNKMAFPKDAANKDLPRPGNFSELMKKADESFNKAVEIKPDYVIGLYSLGIFYNNWGADILKQSESMKDPKKIKTEEDRADGIFRKAIPLLEKAHELDKTDKDTMRTLRQLYARTGQGESEKYKKLSEELKGAK